MNKHQTGWKQNKQANNLLIQLNNYEEEILDLFQNKDNLIQSDIVEVVQCIVHKIHLNAMKYKSSNK